MIKIFSLNIKSALALVGTNLLFVGIAVFLTLKNMFGTAILIWLIYSVLYSIISYMILRIKYCASNIKFVVLLISSVIAIGFLFILSINSKDIYANYFQASLFFGEMIFIIIAIADWCISVIISLITKHIVDSKGEKDATKTGRINKQ